MKKNKSANTSSTTLTRGFVDMGYVYFMSVLNDAFCRAMPDVGSDNRCTASICCACLLLPEEIQGD